MKSHSLTRRSETLNKLANGFTLEKRFESEFEKIEKIGRGGFASVYKVRNILDNSLYAIKKIKIKIDSKNRELQKEISGVLQEIRYLAKFKSEYIVTYNHSWVEVNLKKETNLEQENNNLRRKKINKNKKLISEENSFSEDLDYDSFNGGHSLVQFEEPGEIFKWDDDDEKEINSSEDQEEIKEENSIKIGSKDYSFNEIESISIFIQMSLCDQTLGDFLETRNKKVTNSFKKNTHANKPDENYIHTLKIFESILLGVDYIHNKENLIHRDLKPNNIFFAGEKVKIGDLGLATDSLNKKCDMMCPSPILERSLIDGKDTNSDNFQNYQDYESEDYSNDELGLDSSFKLQIEETESSPSEMFLELEKERNYNKLKHTLEYEEMPHVVHTSNIGTSQYAAPEQLNNIYYDNKVDIYSLGLILLEIVYPFKTRMEKHEITEMLKTKRTLPSSIDTEIANLILKMTESDPIKRFDIKQAMQTFQFILEKIIQNKQEEQINTNYLKLKDLNRQIANNNSPITNESLNFEHREKLGFAMHTPTNRSTSVNDSYFNFSERLCKTNSDYFTEKRRRFLSEDIGSVQSYKFYMKSEDEWQNIWIKLLNEKMLIYYKENSKKANVIYDLSECNLKGSYFKDKFDIAIPQFKKTPTFVNLSKPRLDSINEKRRRSSNFHSFSTTLNSLEDDEELNSADMHLNFLIEVDHPYQKKCFFKGEHIFDTVEFYQKIKRLIE